MSRYETHSVMRPRKFLVKSRVWMSCGQKRKVRMFSEESGMEGCNDIG